MTRSKSVVRFLAFSIVMGTMGPAALHARDPARHPVDAHGAGPAHGPTPRLGTRAERDRNDRQAAAMRDRIGAAERRVDLAGREGRLPAHRAGELRRDLRETRRDLDAVQRRQGFVSAGEFASYERVLATVDAAIGSRGR